MSFFAASILEGVISVALIDKETSNAIKSGAPCVFTCGISSPAICICNGYNAPAQIKEIIIKERIRCNFFLTNDTGTTKGRCFHICSTPRPTSIIHALAIHACGCPIYHVTPVNYEHIKHPR